MSGPVAALPKVAEELGLEGRVAFGFVRVLRHSGLEVPLSALLEFVRAIRLLGIDNPSGVYWAGRSTLLSRQEDLELYDRCFSAYFSPAPPAVEMPEEAHSELHVVSIEDEAPEVAEGDPGQPGSARYSAREVLTERDFAGLTEEEREEAAALIRAIRFERVMRRTRRLRPTKRLAHHPDLRAAVRRAVHLDGEIRIERYLERSVAPRRLVLLLDVSGSMEPYSRELLRFAQAAVASGERVEAFALGTRLTRLTRQLGGADPEGALRAAVAAIPDLAGGTRLGESLGAFNSLFGVRGLARGATVVLISDGIDRGEPERLAAELERLGRVAHRVIWVNPLLSSPGYAPLARGMAAALEHLDEFVPGHSVGALAELASLITNRRPRPLRRPSD